MEQDNQQQAPQNINFDGDDYDVMEGSKTFKLETLAAGASATHTYVMQPTTSDAAVVRRRAKVMYSYAAADGETKTIKAFSSSAFGEALKIVSKEQHKKDTSLYVVRCVACDRRLARQRCAVDPYAPSCVTRPPPRNAPGFCHTTCAHTPTPRSHSRSQSSQEEWSTFAALALGPVLLPLFIFLTSKA